MNIFEQLNILLTESEDKSKVKESDIPIHPEMETKEQGEMAAAEKILKLFQKLQFGSGDNKESIKDSRPEIPDDMIDPMMKEKPKSTKDKSFEKNKLAGWDEKSEEKIKKEVEVDNRETDIDDDFDDFDYHKNIFGDEEDDEIPEHEEDDRSEDEKLKDTIDDAIDSLNNEQNNNGSGQESGDGDDSGANWGDEESENNGQQNTKEGGQQSDGNTTQDGGEDGEDGEDGESSKGSKSSTKSGGKKETLSQKQKRLEELKKSLESGEMKEFNDKMDEIKNTTDVSDGYDIPGGQIETPSDETFKDEMKKAGFDDKTIDKMNKEKNINGNEDFSEEEAEELRKKVVDGLEDACQKKGGSALASTIVKNAVKRKLNNDEWKEMLKVFLKSKSVGVGKMSSANKDIKWGHKNHLWRDAILPTDGPSKGTIQTIYCFVDFSGSVKEDLVFTFLGKVIDMCVELKYTKVHVYGFGEYLTEPRIIDKKSLKNGVDVALSQTWDFISSQNPGYSTENFSAVTEEINKIKRKEKDAVFLIFGDAFWDDPILGPKCLKYEMMNTKYLNDICILAYYETMNKWFAGNINILREIVGIKHIITTKVTSIHK